MIVFHNPGLVDIDAITTFGVNVKESNNPIGFFGTGFKYAVATILRGGGQVTVYRGNERYHFETGSKTIRGEEFKLVWLMQQIHDETQCRQLGFTTDLGKNWEPWMAYRELFCNAKDEGGGVEGSDLIEPGEDETRIVVDWEPFEEVYQRHGEYFLSESRAPIGSSARIEVYGGKSSHVFYRGIRVAQLSRMSNFTYNLLGQQELTEDRTLKNGVVGDLRVYWMSDCANEELLSEMLQIKNPDLLEPGIDFDCSWIDMSPEFEKVVGDLHQRRVPHLNQSAVQRLLRERPAERPSEFPMDDLDQTRLKKAVSFCKRMNFAVDDYPIVVTESLGHGVLGQADLDREEIYLAHQVFHQGTKQVVSTLIEEYVHMRHGKSDLTYDMQTYLFDNIVSLGERLLGEPL